MGLWRLERSFLSSDLADVQWLGYYSNRFQTTELNYSFYHVPTAETYRRWCRLVPPEFVFALKANRLITHIGRLVEAPAWNDFVIRARELGRHLGPILVQLPPSFRRDHHRLAEFLERASSLSAPVRLAFEFRHVSWFCDETYRLLRRYGAALCMADGSRYPRANQVTADFAYLRFHGRTPPEAPCYNDEQLRQEAKFIQNLALQGIETYVYFNNDALAHAPANAARLKQLVDERRSAA